MLVVGPSGDEAFQKEVKPLDHVPPGPLLLCHHEVILPIYHKILYHRRFKAKGPQWVAIIVNLSSPESLEKRNLNSEITHIRQGCGYSSEALFE